MRFRRLLLSAAVPSSSLSSSSSSSSSPSHGLVPWQSYVSRPDILAPALDVRTYEARSVAPGYIFLSTWHDSEALNGPYIYTNDGNLIWSGHNPSLAATKYFNFQTHRLRAGGSRSILSVFRGHSDRGRGQGHVALVDDSYRVLRTIACPEAAARASLDFHEFRLADDGRTAVAVALVPIQRDLGAWGIEEGLGWVLDSVMYVMALGQDGARDQVRFVWRASEHVPLQESVVPPSAHRLAGMSYRHAYDYFHINSIDRFADGDYLLSARHTDVVYRISGKDGSIVWRLGGRNSSFDMLGFRFSAQHDARIVHEAGPDRLVISLFDNAYNGETHTSNASSALVIALDLPRKTARVLQQFFPARGGLAQNQGSVQVLPGGNTLVSWGLIAEFSEVDARGNRVLDVAFADPETRAYRVRKSDWVGRPRDSDMALYLYSRRRGSKTHFWMSWNGATEVDRWLVYATTAPTTAPATTATNASHRIGSTASHGFETHFAAPGFVPAGYVEAVDRSGQVLGRSKPVPVSVPPPSLADRCFDEHCTMQVLPEKKARAAAPGARKMPRERVDPGWMTGWLNMALGFAVGLGLAKLGFPQRIARVARRR